MQVILHNIYLFFHVLHSEVLSRQMKDLGRKQLVSRDHSSERNATENAYSTGLGFKSPDQSLALHI